MSIILGIQLYVLVSDSALTVLSLGLVDRIYKNKKIFAVNVRKRAKVTYYRRISYEKQLHTLHFQICDKPAS